MPKYNIGDIIKGKFYYGDDSESHFLIENIVLDGINRMFYSVRDLEYNDIMEISVSEIDYDKFVMVA